MFEKSIPYYDRIYAGKDYAGEAARLRGFIEPRLATGGTRLLDVACGTGRHLEYLGKDYAAEGLDISPRLIEIARARNPGMPFHVGSMVDFDLGARFDVVTCLFSSIGYLTSLDEVRRTAATFHRHLVPRGLVLVEPWFRPDQWKVPSCHGTFLEEPDLKIARLNTSHRKGRISWFDLHYLVATPERTEHFVEHHEMALLETDELVGAFEGAGFQVEFDDEGLTGRGLLVGTRRP